MNAFENIKTELLSARKNKNTTKANLYSFLLGETTRKNKIPSDEEVYNTIKAYIKSVSSLSLNGADAVNRDMEVSYANDLLPKQLTQSELSDVITSFLLENEAAKANFGLLMSYMKNNYNGKFNPGDVRNIWEKCK